MNNEQMKNTDGSNGVPIFTPPPPTFKPPENTSPRHNGSVCYYHNDEPAVARCAKCGKFICQDCYDNYGVTGGDYAGQALCYDCCREIVADNVAELTRNKSVVKFHFILSIIGMVIGFIIGLVTGIESGGIGAGFLSGLVFACIGSMFLNFMKFFFSTIWDAIKTGFSNGIVAAIIGLLIALTVGTVKAIFYTIKNTISYIVYLRRTSGFIESDSAALQQMADYMEYTKIRNQNRGVDIETLLKQKSELADNSYAHMVQQRGEEGAEAAMRNCVATFNEHGEIIRNFNVAGRTAA